MGNVRAAIFMVMAMAAFTCNDAIVKRLSDDLPIAEVLLYRGLLATGFFLFLLGLQKSAIPQEQKPGYKRFLNRWNLIRATIEVAVTFLFLTGVMLLPLATATTLIFAGPFVLTGLAALVLKERVGLWRWSAVLAGFIGVVIIAQPGGENLNWAIMLPLGAAFLTAFRDIAVRFIPQSLTSVDIALTTAVAVMLGGLAVSILRGLNGLNGETALLLFFGASFLCTAYYFYVQATRTGELSFVAPFKYVSILLAFVLDALIWGHIPTASTLTGGAIIVAAGMVILYRETRNAAPS